VTSDFRFQNKSKLSALCPYMKFLWSCTKCFESKLSSVGIPCAMLTILSNYVVKWRCQMFRCQLGHLLAWGRGVCNLWRIGMQCENCVHFVNTLYKRTMSTPEERIVRTHRVDTLWGHMYVDILWGHIVWTLCGRIVETYCGHILWTHCVHTLWTVC